MLRTVSLLTAILFAGATAALAQPYPARPVRGVVGFAAGSASDLVARALVIWN